MTGVSVAAARKKIINKSYYYKITMTFGTHCSLIITWFENNCDNEGTVKYFSG